MLDFSRYAESRTLVLGLAVLGLLGFGVLVWRARLRCSVRVTWCLALGWGWVFALAILTLVPVDLGGTSVNFVPFDGLLSDSFSLINFALNALLFVPAGAIIAFARVDRPGLWLSLVVVGAVAIEIIQYYANLQRSSDVNDVLAAAFGLLVGAVVVGLLSSDQAAVTPPRSAYGEGVPR